MKRFQQLMYSMLVIIFFIIGLMSCDNSKDFEPIAPSLSKEEMQNLRQTRALQNGWKDGLNANGIRYYSKQVGMRSWYVIKIYLPQVKISPVYRIHSESVDSDNPTFYKQDLGEWNSSSEGRNAIALVNASYFNFDYTQNYGTGDYGIFGRKAELSHPLSSNGNIIAQGFDSENPNLQTFAVVNKKAYIGMQSYSNAEVSVSGFDPYKEKKKPTEKVGRTMVGIPYNGSDIAYIFVTGDDVGYGATQNEAIDALKRDFGCKSIVMFDGSASSQFYWKGKIMVDSQDLASIPRRMPVALRMDRR